MADLKTTQDRRDRFRAWLHDDTRDHLSIRAWCVAEDACDDVDTLLAENERARQPAQDRATDEELVAIFENAYEHGALENIVGVRAVAAHVRGERCLIARAVAVGEGFSVTRRATGAGWRIRMVGGPGAECAPADVPATLARLLGEVSRG